MHQVQENAQLAAKENAAKDSKKTDAAAQNVQAKETKKTDAPTQKVQEKNVDTGKNPRAAAQVDSFNSAALYNTRGYMSMSYTFASFGFVLGLTLLFGGVRVPIVSNAIVLGYGFGLVGFSFIWFGVSGGYTKWYQPFLAAYGAGAVLGILFICAAIGIPAGSTYTISMLGGVFFMVLGVMLNTAGIYKSSTREPYYTFSLCVGLGFLIGACFYFVVKRQSIGHPRYFAIAAYSFVGSYLFIKFCGIVANQYPIEWGNLRTDPHAGTWEYFLMFAFTFITAGLAFTFQFFVYPRDGDDIYARVGADDPGNKSVKGRYSKRDYPSHASTRRLLSGESSAATMSSTPRFGGLRGSSLHGRPVERYISNQ
eukprot:CAMPEP_0203770442 /NCGR_PEP_ID=MMETSP0099_2-20121227/2818_1 /ASSEMBLY_ACC=CAM_ASM_000209 /TAXON_ID=96639 /ORGANISM=" , Strain NY0313808BC1" /LENGTH=366 /DNA_ID=CAMNT_0050667589 /DNA_START=231 /DNA_END=1331 /DNA_ORIENTATION=+